MRWFGYIHAILIVGATRAFVTPGGRSLQAGRERRSRAGCRGFIGTTTTTTSITTPPPPVPGACVAGRSLVSLRAKRGRGGPEKPTGTPKRGGSGSGDSGGKSSSNKLFRGGRGGGGGGAGGGGNSDNDARFESNAIVTSAIRMKCNNNITDSSQVQ